MRRSDTNHAGGLIPIMRNWNETQKAQAPCRGRAAELQILVLKVDHLRRVGEALSPVLLRLKPAALSGPHSAISLSLRNSIRLEIAPLEKSVGRRRSWSYPQRKSKVGSFTTWRMHTMDMRSRFECRSTSLE